MFKIISQQFQKKKIIVYFLQVCRAQDSGGLNPEEELVSFGRPPGAADGTFSPIVSASCRAGETFSPVLSS
jgi:hypothetical protein